jgi:hypothetical protein
MNMSLDLDMMTTIGLRSLPDKAPNCQSPPNIVSNPTPKSVLSILTGNQGNSIPGDNMDKIIVLVYYTNPNHDVAGLRNSTQNT